MFAATSLPRDARLPGAALQRSEVRVILITGPHLAAMESAAVTLFREGHLPVIGEWLASPLDLRRDPVTERLLARCDAVLRVHGPSAEADAVASLARSFGLRVFHTVEDALAG